MKYENNLINIKNGGEHDKARIVKFWNRNSDSDFGRVFDWMYLGNQTSNKIYYLADSFET